MTRILLVDDNRILIRSLSATVPWAEHDIEVAGTAFNGEEALPLLNDTIDVLVTDIKMPRMDGIALTNWAAERFPNIRTIFLSAYNEFDYAVSAIQMRVSDYVSKPVDHARLIEAVQKAALEKKHSEEARSRLNAYLPYVRERMLIRLLEGGQIDSPLEGELAQLFPGWKSPAYFLCVVYEIRTSACAPLENAVSERLIRVYDIQMLVDEVFNGFNIHSVVLNERMMAGVLSFMSEPDDICLDDVLKRNKQVMTRAKWQGAELAIGMSSILSGIQNLSALCRQARRALGAPSRIPSDAILVYPTRAAAQTRNLEWANRALNIADAMAADHNKRAFFDHMEEMLRELEQIDDGELFAVTTVCALGGFVKSYLAEAKLPKDLFSEWVSVQTRLLKDGREAAAGMLRQFIQKLYDDQLDTMEAESSSIIADIYKAIRKVQYDSDGGLQKIARLVCLSPSYVSMIFKQQTGENIIDCIQKLRLERAKQLLWNDALKIYEISEMVGYTNQYYFSVWFKRNTGFTPSEYRKLQGRE